MELSYDLKNIIFPIIREAGEIVLSAHNLSNDPDGISEKEGSGNFVTEYDVRVQEFIIERLSKAFEGACFVAEEKDNDPSTASSECCFIIDPIDGTSNFIHDYRHSCISVAMLCRGKTVFGAVYDPYLREMFHAEAGRGAYLNGDPIRVSDRPIELSITAYGTAPYYRDTLGDKTFALCREVFDRCADIRRCGAAALDLAYLAAGRNDLFFEVLLSPWDYAAGQLLITEAGGIITDMCGDELTIKKPSSVIAGNPIAFPALLELSKKYQ